jgi:hypothetical protein
MTSKLNYYYTMRRCFKNLEYNEYIEANSINKILFRFKSPDARLSSVSSVRTSSARLRLDALIKMLLVQRYQINKNLEAEGRQYGHGLSLFK